MPVGTCAGQRTPSQLDALPLPGPPHLDTNHPPLLVCQLLKGPDRDICSGGGGQRQQRSLGNGGSKAQVPPAGLVHRGEASSHCPTHPCGPCPRSTTACCCTCSQVRAGQGRQH